MFKHVSIVYDDDFGLFQGTATIFFRHWHFEVREGENKSDRMWYVDSDSSCG